MPKVGGRRKKTRTHVRLSKEEENVQKVDEDLPRSFVIRTSRLRGHLSTLITDLRRVLSPHTAMNLREKRTNRLKDFLQVANPLGITHILGLSQTDASINLRISRMPEGPSLQFKVLEYSLMEDVARYRSQAGGQVDPSYALKVPPLVVLSKFNAKDHNTTVMKTFFQGLFPPLNIGRVNYSQCKRVVLFQKDEEHDCVHVRHYLIRTNQMGLSRAVREVTEGYRLPDLSSFQTMHDFVKARLVKRAQQQLGEDGGLTVDDLASNSSAKSNHLSGVKLEEIGPRLTLQLFKVETGVTGGEVLFHRFQEKSEEEKEELREKVKRKREEKEERKKVQEENVARKRQRVEEKKEKKRMRKEQRAKQREEEEEEEEED